MLDWQTMSEDDFNRLAEALILRSVKEDSPGLEARAIDGRGGDGGIDIDVRVKRTDQLVAIYQLKFFREGFSGAWAKARKPQIKKSFTAALRHKPPIWYLVVPRNLTTKERTYVRALQEKRERPRTGYLGAAELDALLVRFPDLEEWAQRGPLRSALELVGRPSAALSQPDDLGTEVMELAQRIQPRSDYWDVNFSRTGSVYTETLVAKRPDAAEREPLSLTFEADFTERPELGDAFQRSLEVGLTEPLVLPADVVKEFEKHGPDWFAGRVGPGQLELHPIPRALDVPVVVTLLGPDDRALAQRIAVSARSTKGSQGGQIVVDLGDNIVFVFVIDREQPEKSRVDMNSDLAGLSGNSAKRALRFMAALSQVEKISCSIDGRPLVGATGGPRKAPEPFQAELADDLAYIEDELNVTIPYPQTIDSLNDRIWVRVIRHLLEGKVSLMPGVSDMNFVLNGAIDPNIEGLLEEGGAIRQTRDPMSFDILGHVLVVDEVSTLMPDVIVEGGAGHLAALRAGKGEGREVQIKPADGIAGILIWAPRRIGDLEILAPTPWGLSDIPEHRQLRTETD